MDDAPLVAPRALILDFGEVLTRPQPRETVERMAALARLPFEALVSRYWQHRRAYDGGLPAAEYWARVLDGLDDLPEDTVPHLIDTDALSWSDFRPAVWNIAARFRANGGRTAMLSNGVPEIISRIRAARPLEEWFDVVIVSCEVGCSKPDPAIYRLCIERLGVPAREALFVDDRLENLEAAAAIGLGTLHFTGDHTVQELQDRLGPQPF
jgi:putative hydrolase of the HAD superfamily